MPVVVTGADTALGAAVVAAFLAARAAGEELELRATVRERASVDALVAAGVRTAVSDLTDAQRLGAVLEEAHTVVHLDDPAATWDLLLDAAEDSGVVRLVTVLPPGASPPAGAEYEIVVLRAAPGVALEAVAAAVLAADRRSASPAAPRVQVLDVPG